MRSAIWTLATATALALALPATAHESIYAAALTGSAENPPNASPGSGAARVTIDFDLVTMRVEASFLDLMGTTTASHIHCCAAADANAGVASQTPSFTGFPLGVMAGSYDHTFDMTMASSYNAAFITANGGTVSGAFNALVAGLDGGLAYFNIHTTSFPGGELRGQLALVPEAETWALMLAGLAAVGAATRRRRLPA
jgi:CHRD domain/PEP-CTERM motif